jgi:hypothetical protein
MVANDVQVAPTGFDKIVAHLAKILVPPRAAPPVTKVLRNKTEVPPHAEQTRQDGLETRAVGGIREIYISQKTFRYSP